MILVAARRGLGRATLFSHSVGQRISVGSQPSKDAVRTSLVTRRLNAQERTPDAGDRPFEACADAVDQATRQVVDGLVRTRETVLLGIVDQARVSLCHDTHLRDGIDAEVVRVPECRTLVARTQLPVSFPVTTASHSRLVCCVGSYGCRAGGPPAWWASPASLPRLPLLQST